MASAAIRNIAEQSVKEAAKASAKAALKEAIESLAKSAALASTKEAIKSAAKISASKATKEAVDSAAKAALIKVAKETAEATLEKATKEAAEAATEHLAKNTVESAAKLASKNLAKKTAEKSLQTVSKELTEATSNVAIKQAAKEAAETAAEEAGKEAAEAAAEVTAKTAAKNAAESAATIAAKNAEPSLKLFIKNNAGKILLGVAAATAAGYAYDKFKSLNNKTYAIKSIIPNKTGGVFGIGAKESLRIEYSDPEKEKLRVNDTIVIINSDSKALAEGTYVILRADNSIPSITVGKNANDTTPMPDITQNGTTGSFTYITSFESQISGMLGDAAGKTTEVLGDSVKNVTDETLKGLGIPEDWLDYVYAFIAFIIFVLLMGALYKGYEMLRSKTTQSAQVEAPPPNYAEIATPPPTIPAPVTQPIASQPVAPTIPAPVAQPIASQPVAPTIPAPVAQPAT